MLLEGLAGAERHQRQHHVTRVVEHRGDDAPDSPPCQSELRHLRRSCRSPGLEPSGPDLAEAGAGSKFAPAWERLSPGRPLHLFFACPTRRAVLTWPMRSKTGMSTGRGVTALHVGLSNGLRVSMTA